MKGHLNFFHWLRLSNKINSRQMHMHSQHKTMCFDVHACSCWPVMRAMWCVEVVGTCGLKLGPSCEVPTQCTNACTQTTWILTTNTFEHVRGVYCLDVVQKNWKLNWDLGVWYALWCYTPPTTTTFSPWKCVWATMCHGFTNHITHIKNLWRYPLMENGPNHD